MIGHGRGTIYMTQDSQYIYIHNLNEILTPLSQASVDDPWVRSRFHPFPLYRSHSSSAEEQDHPHRRSSGTKAEGGHAWKILLMEEIPNNHLGYMKPFT